MHLLVDVHLYVVGHRVRTRHGHRISDDDTVHVPKILFCDFLHDIPQDVGIQVVVTEIDQRLDVVEYFRVLGDILPISNVFLEIRLLVPQDGAHLRSFLDGELGLHTLLIEDIAVQTEILAVLLARQVVLVAVVVMAIREIREHFATVVARLTSRAAVIQRGGVVVVVRGRTISPDRETGGLPTFGSIDIRPGKFIAAGLGSRHTDQVALNEDPGGRQVGLHDLLLLQVVTRAAQKGDAQHGKKNSFFHHY